MCCVCSLLQVGSMIILCHEINDIFLEAAKMGRYSGHELVPTILFVAFVVSWVLTRLVYFPAFVIWNIYTEPPKVHPYSASDSASLLSSHGGEVANFHACSWLKSTGQTYHRTGRCSWHCSASS